MDLKKDGTQYFALVEFESFEYGKSGQTRWEIIHWGHPAMQDLITGGWCSQSGLGLRWKQIHKAVPIDQVVTWLDTLPN